MHKAWIARREGGRSVLHLSTLDGWTVDQVVGDRGDGGAPDVPEVEALRRLLRSVLSDQHIVLTRLRNEYFVAGGEMTKAEAVELIDVTLRVNAGRDRALSKLPPLQELIDRFAGNRTSGYSGRVKR